MSPRETDASRTCLGCRRQRPRAELNRIVREPGGEACFDLDANLPGRGAWVCPSPACLDAVPPGALAHVLRAPVRLAPAAGRRRELAEARIDARSAWYVIGSDMLGPMGHELIPHPTDAEAREFLRDHKGARVLRYGNVAPDLLHRLDEGRFD